MDTRPCLKHDAQQPGFILGVCSPANVEKRSSTHEVERHVLVVKHDIGFYFHVESG